ncbi:uncharacterized protein BJ171DRAFT_576978 [Polychytrium aggregatum]|uniref:uncharacterized protein n=1 Tax=Polychytrium aggregatum TaxID=110093 RepID=UPI0022FEFF47|nr:uncharacterized protein BJ171DRAFT_576978 [Polychytrium aggregatum]KAI9209361.1 hypothetical protein BJ171DRAFT_576978 [Polychytrium aggregatum]
MEFLSKHSAVQSVFILRFLDFTYVQVSNTDVARFGTSLWDSADTTSPSDWPRVDITACPACKTCVTRGFLMYERLTAISHSTDSANRGGLGFRLVPRVLCPGCHSTIMLCLTEASSPPVEGPPPPSLYDVWRSDDVRAFVSAYGHYWLNTFSILSSKRIRLSEDMTSMFLSFGICSRCRKPSKWKCSRCSKSYYCGRRCQKRDWLAHKEICDQKESPLALF